MDAINQSHVCPGCKSQVTSQVDLTGMTSCPACGSNYDIQFAINLVLFEDAKKSGDFTILKKAMQEYQRHNCYLQPVQGICCGCGGSPAKSRCDVDDHGRHCQHWQVINLPLTEKEASFLRDALGRIAPEFYAREGDTDKMVYNIIMKMGLPQDGWLRESNIHDREAN